ncbi:unnamed protein product [Paramecium octaurelia]|uniref:Uncharacterized protein n=1 Tax=Paramecium octaurelia TaxID=43137 RepID=A0A8S1VPI3_PAROT|nr:unnamed protein product [Paramecium octaurelia]
MYKKNSTEKLVRKNASPTHEKENNSYARKYSRKLLSRQSNHDEYENVKDNVLSTYNSNTNSTNQSESVTQLQQIIQQQKRQIQNLKMGCPRCLTKQNTDLELRNKILVQNNQILSLLSRETQQSDYTELYKINQMLQQQNEELKLNNEILIQNQQEILQENMFLKNLFAESNNITNAKENSSQLFSLSQSQGRFSSILQLNSQVQSPSHAKQHHEKLFARFFPQQQQLDSLLADPDCELETILSADNILQEIKGVGANKFADHITKHPEMYQRMIHYVISVDDELIDKKTQIQYPFLCSEILGSQNQKLLDFLFERPEEGIEADAEMIRVNLYDQLISFLEADVFNMTSAGYFSKAFLAIIKKRGFDVWTQIINNKQILSNLIKHIDCKHIAEIIEKLIILDTTQEFTNETFLNERKILLQRIIILMQNKYYCSEIVENVCEVLIEITTKNMSCLYYNNPDIVPFIDQITRPELLFEIAMKTQKPQPIQVIINLVEMSSKESKKEEDDEVIHNNEKDFSIFQNIVPELPQNLLSKRYCAANFKNSNQEQVQPFGLHKIMLLKLIQTFVQTNDITVIEALLNAGLIQVLETICIQYPSNNQIHIITEKIIKSILDLNDEKLTENVFEFGSLIEFIIGYHTEQNEKKGYLALLTSLSNYLLEKSYNKTILQYYQDNEQWMEFVKNRLSNINQKEKPFLCNVNPKAKSEVADDQESDIMQILQKVNDSQYGQQNQSEQYQEKESQKIEQELENNNQQDDGGLEDDENILMDMNDDQGWNEDILQTKKQNQDDQAQGNLNQESSQSTSDNDKELIHKDDNVSSLFNHSLFWKIEYDNKEAEDILNNYA